MIEWGIFPYNEIRLPQSTLSENVLDITLSEYNIRRSRLSETNIKKKTPLNAYNIIFHPANGVWNICMANYTSEYTGDRFMAVVSWKKEYASKVLHGELATSAIE